MAAEGVSSERGQEGRGRSLGLKGGSRTKIQSVFVREGWLKMQHGVLEAAGAAFTRELARSSAYSLRCAGEELQERNSLAGRRKRANPAGLFGAIACQRLERQLHVGTLR
eukprot:765212-Hanusia_phi.AAC.8